MEKKIVFSENFVWGAATSAYQIEGAVKEDGKGEHIWDVYTKEPGKVYSGHTGEVACDHYHRYDFLARYLRELRKAAEEADIRGYLQWSFMDNFEWGQRLLRSIWTRICGLQKSGENYERFRILV